MTEKPSSSIPQLPSAAGRWIHRYGWTALGATAIGGLGLSFVGYLRVVQSASPPEGSAIGEALTALYQSLIGFWFNAGGLGVPWTLQIGRLLTLIAAAVMGSSLIIQVLRAEFRRGRARHMRDHIIICGLGDLGTAAADALHEAGNRIVVVDSAPSFATEALARRGAGIVIGDAADPLTLLEAGADHAQTLIACCGNDDQNAKVTEAARTVIEQLERRTHGSLSVRAHIDDPDLLRQLRPSILKLTTPGIDVDFFSVAEMAASHIIDSTVSGELTRGAEDFDVVVVGDAFLAEQLLLRLAAATPSAPAAVNRPVVLIACPQATTFVEFLRERHCSLDRHLELRAQDVGLHREGAPIESVLITDGRPLFRLAFVCTQDDGDTIRIGLNLTSAARYRPDGFQAIACIYGQSGVATLAEHATTRGLRVFDVTDAVRDSSLVTMDTVDLLARLVHDSYFRDELAKPASERTSKFEPWGGLDEQTREDNRDHVRAFLSRLSEAGLRLVPLTDLDEAPAAIEGETLEMLAQNEHARWCRFKEVHGWTLGERDDHHKVHDCLVPWGQLDEKQRDKDRNPIRRMPRLLKDAGIALVHDDSVRT